jgi:crotonobetainyl-CoA:carnitine CoA-transferase CaiB-like acyl-CoA transferase
MGLPLDGIKVIDLSRLLPGPLCTLILADLGAEVIKVEDHMGGDYIRWIEPKMKHQNPTFYALNRNKKSIRLNLRFEEGKEILKNLIRSADVVVETFRPEVMERLGLGWNQLKDINPHLIYCSLTGYGQNGPYKELPGHDLNYLAITGALSMMQTRGGVPVMAGLPIADIGGGSLPAAVAILAALYSVRSTGIGQFVDVAMVDGLSFFLSFLMTQYMADKDLHRIENDWINGGYAFYNVYQASDGKYLALGCVEEKFWSNFCKVIKREELIPEMFSEEPRRSKIIDEIAEVIKSKTSSEWLEVFRHSDVCITKVNNLEEALNNPHIMQRQLWFMQEYSPEGLIPQMNFPVKFSEKNLGWRTPPPQLGEHTEDVLLSIGYSSKDIEELSKKKVI